MKNSDYLNQECPFQETVEKVWNSHDVFVKAQLLTFRIYEPIPIKSFSQFFGSFDHCSIQFWGGYAFVDITPKFEIEQWPKESRKLTRIFIGIGS